MLFICTFLYHPIGWVSCTEGELEPGFLMLNMQQPQILVSTTCWGGWGCTVVGLYIMEANMQTYSARKGSS